MGMFYWSNDTVLITAVQNDQALKQKRSGVDHFVFIGSTCYGHGDHLMCCQWLQRSQVKWGKWFFSIIVCRRFNETMINIRKVERCSYMGILFFGIWHPRKIIIFKRGPVSRNENWKYGDAQLSKTTRILYLGMTFSSNGYFNQAQRILCDQASKVLFSILKSMNGFVDIIPEIMLYVGCIW